MINRINMIGIDSGAHHSPTHSGTQQVVRK